MRSQCGECPGSELESAPTTAILWRFECAIHIQRAHYRERRSCRRSWRGDRASPGSTCWRPTATASARATSSAGDCCLPSPRSPAGWPPAADQRSSDSIESLSSSPYNLYMKLPALVDGRGPERKPVISARESITDENFRGYPDHPDGPVARPDEAPTPPPRSVEGWF
jgi:hypothetical protein